MFRHALRGVDERGRAYCVTSGARLGEMAKPEVSAAGVRSHAAWTLVWYCGTGWYDALSLKEPCAD
ncbi:hypothetical protein KB1_06050 [Cutibacterium modestum]|uniref:Uncharacterized protein n=1 Tax=Cutibacterium modestum TaxID=2559073 RepID=A0AAD1KPG5_9ACTN|nr:hypothetical protein KB1_06050 [Cutibacterium modestum]